MEQSCAGTRIAAQERASAVTAGLRLEVTVEERMPVEGGETPSPCLVPGRNIGSKLTVSVDASSCSGRTERICSLEHVQVQLSLSYSRRGDLVLALSSPMGTTSTLVTVR